MRYRLPSGLRMDLEKLLYEAAQGSTNISTRNIYQGYVLQNNKMLTYYP